MRFLVLGVGFREANVCMHPFEIFTRVVEIYKGERGVLKKRIYEVHDRLMAAGKGVVTYETYTLAIAGTKFTIIRDLGDHKNFDVVLSYDIILDDLKLNVSEEEALRLLDRFEQQV